MKVLTQSFFRRPVLKVAPNLLGKYLVRKMSNGKIVRLLITEVEAYDGPNDLANHASKGKTDRTKIMFETGGVWYVYLIYGMYHMLNVVTGDPNYPATVLIRGTKEVSGPGRLTKYLKIDKKLNGKTSAKASGLWFEESNIKIPKKDIQRLPRVGVDYAKEWVDKPWRFVWKRV